MNRRETNEYILNNSSPKVLEELIERVECSDESDFDFVDAFIWMIELIDEDRGSFPPSYRPATMKLEIGLGLLVPVTQEQIDNTFVLGRGGKSKLFKKMDGQSYESPMAWSTWEASLGEEK